MSFAPPSIVQLESISRHLFDHNTVTIRYWEGGTTVGRSVVHKLFASRKFVCISITRLTDDAIENLMSAINRLYAVSHLEVLLLIDLDREQQGSRGDGADHVHRLRDIYSTTPWVRMLEIVHVHTETNADYVAYAEAKGWRTIRLEQLTISEMEQIQRRMADALLGSSNGQSRKDTL